MNTGEHSVDAFTLHLNYDSTMLSYISCTEGDLVPQGGWILFDCNESVAGDVVIGGFAVNSSIPSGSAGVLARLVFENVCSGCQNGDTSLLVPDRFADDIAGFDDESGVFTYLCDVTPTPTSTAMPPTATPDPTVTPSFTPHPTGTPTPNPTATLTPTAVPPTNTPTNTPTGTPTNTPTNTPTHTFTPEPTNTPTHTPTAAPPTITPTVLPTATPTSSIRELGAYISMPEREFVPGDVCGVSIVVANPGNEEYTGRPLFAILDVYGSFYFWPDWSDFDFEVIDVGPMEEREYTVIPEFIWPQGVGQASGLYFYGAMTNSEITEIFGQWTIWEFEWRTEP